MRRRVVALIDADIRGAYRVRARSNRGSNFRLFGQS